MRCWYWRPSASSPPQRARTPKGRAEYPEWLSERPLVLAPWLGQAALDLGIGSTYHGSAGVSFGFSGDIGLPHKTQVGASFVLPLFPGPDFGAFIATVQGNVIPQLNVRFDIGVVRTSVHADNPLGPDDTRLDMFVAGLGLPYKVRVHKMVSIIGGRTRAGAAVLNPVINIGHGARVYGGFTSDDVLTVIVSGVKNDSQAVGGSFNIPVGVEVQPAKWLSFLVRTGYRLTFARDVKASDSKTSLIHLIPLELGVEGHPHRLVDVGFSAMLYGPVASSNETESDKVYKRYSDVRNFSLWIAGRF